MRSNLPSNTSAEGESGIERRGALRVRPGPLRVRFNRAHEGILVNISETGALVQSSSSVAPEMKVTLSLEGQNGPLQLPARVVRSSPGRLAEGSEAGQEYHVALEFSDLPPEQVVALQRLIRAKGE